MQNSKNFLHEQKNSKNNWRNWWNHFSASENYPPILCGMWWLMRCLLCSIVHRYIGNSSKASKICFKCRNQIALVVGDAFYGGEENWLTLNSIHLKQLMLYVQKHQFQTKLSLLWLKLPENLPKNQHLDPEIILQHDWAGAYGWSTIGWWNSHWNN